jgi:hypothetical protein
MATEKVQVEAAITKGIAEEKAVVPLQDNPVAHDSKAINVAVKGT